MAFLIAIAVIATVSLAIEQMVGTPGAIAFFVAAMLVLGFAG